MKEHLGISKYGNKIGVVRNLATKLATAFS